MLHLWRDGHLPGQWEPQPTSSRLNTRLPLGRRKVDHSNKEVLMRKHVFSATLALVASAVIAPVAFGHAAVTKRTPGPGASLTTVKVVELKWDEPVVTGRLCVYRAGIIKVGCGTLSRNKQSIAAGWSTRLPRARYTVQWSDLADDGHRQSGSWTFTVR